MAFTMIVNSNSTIPIFNPQPESQSKRYIMKKRLIQRTIGQPK